MEVGRFITGKYSKGCEAPRTDKRCIEKSFATDKEKASGQKIKKLTQVWRYKIMAKESADYEY